MSTPEPKKIQLPKLQIVRDIPPRKKILLLSDDLRMHSGIATMSKEFVIQTSDHFNWVQLGAALEHPDHGKIFDISAEVNKERGIDNSSVRIYAHTGYGHADVLREIIALEKPDAILHFTDPRFWEWLYMMEHDIRSHYKIPIMYYNIWDAPPAPFWNKPFYSSCDLIMNISKQTHALVKTVLGEELYNDLDDNTGNGHIQLAYVPHGINAKKYYPINVGDDEYEDYLTFATKFKTTHDVKFIVFWNNRNIRRKQPGDVVLAFRQFCEMLPKEDAQHVALFMHTDMRDPNGTDLPEVVRVMCPNYKVIFNEERLPVNILNYFYNMSDVTISASSNEGFGITTAESVMAGTPIIVNTTGGLQDQVRFSDANNEWVIYNSSYSSNHTGVSKEHGEWAKVVYPTNRSLQGSLATPYILDDRCDYNDVAKQIYQWYMTDPEVRSKNGTKGREWMMSKESGMSSVEMGNRMVKHIDTCLSTFEPKHKYEIFVATDRDRIVETGMIWE